MNIYIDYLMKNFGGMFLGGIKIIGEMLADYDVDNLFQAYKDYAKDNNMSKYAVERAIRYYIRIIATTEEEERILKCKCFNGKNFTNKEFMLAVKFRAEEDYAESCMERSVKEIRWET